MKRTKMPVGFGNAVEESFFAAMSENGDFYEFIKMLQQEFLAMDKDTFSSYSYYREKIDEIQDEKLKKSLEWVWNNLGTIFSKPIFTFGFAMGQAFDVADEHARKDIDFIWKRIREEESLPLLPKGWGKQGRRGER